jgi:hypothetical protein
MVEDTAAGEVSLPRLAQRVPALTGRMWDGFEIRPTTPECGTDLKSVLPHPAPALGLRAGTEGVVIRAQIGFRMEKHHGVLFLAAKLGSIQYR